MSWLLALLLAAMPGWSVMILNGDEFVIANNLQAPITCYVYYSGGDYYKVRIPAGKKSVKLSRYGLIEVDCF